MAEALAKRRWPDCRVGSAGTNVVVDGGGAADEAVTVMNHYNLDIKDHQTTPIAEIDTEAFQFIVALDKRVRRELIEKHSIPESKIKNLFIDDPFTDDIVQYIKCATAIARSLSALSF